VRIVTHTDFDGVVSAVLIQALFPEAETVVFAEPWMLQKSTFPVREGDIIVDLPYGKGCALWFDHHATSADDEEAARADGALGRLDTTAPSCARVLSDHYKTSHPELERFAGLVAATDKIDTASFTREDLERPDVYGKLSIAIRGDDKRKDDEFRRFLINMLSFQPAEQVIGQPIIRKRVEEKLRQLEEWKRRIPEYVTVRGSVILVDRTRAPPDLPRGQPFWLYLMYPHKAVYLSVDNLKYEPEKVKLSCGENIFEDLNRADIGALMKAHGGGGHKAAGGCSIPRSEQERVVNGLVAALNAGSTGE